MCFSLLTHPSYIFSIVILALSPTRHEFFMPTCWVNGCYHTLDAAFITLYKGRGYSGCVSYFLSWVQLWWLQINILWKLPTSGVLLLRDSNPNSNVQCHWVTQEVLKALSQLIIKMFYSIDIVSLKEHPWYKFGAGEFLFFRHWACYVAMLK